MHIENAIVHLVTKEQHSSTVTSKYRDSELPHTPELIALLDRIRRLYSEKTGRAYGAFGATSPFAARLRECEKSSRTFVNFSKEAMGLLETQLRSSLLATRRYMLFARYQHDGSRYLFTAMLKQTDGLSFSDDLDILDVDHLDLDKLHLAARANLTRWSVPKDARYVSFVKGRLNREYRDYFVNFLGVEEMEDSSQQTSELVRVVKEFCSHMPPDEADKAKQRVLDYGQSCIDNSKPIELQAVSNLIIPEDPASFMAFAGQDKYAITNDFIGDKKRLQSLEKIQGGDSEIRLSFDKSILGRRVKYHKDGDTLTISPVPRSIRAQVESDGN